jgi:hypothetical protein
MQYYKQLGDQTFTQLDESGFHYQPAPESNSIAVIIRHLHGNMRSRFTNFLTEDGEKEWRRRDSEFEEAPLSREALLQLWEEGWDCFLSAVQSLSEADLLSTITIRQEPLTVIDALNRQMAHYPYHVGQIVYLGRMYRGTNWKSLSIPKGQSEQFNLQMKTLHK